MELGRNRIFCGSQNAIVSTQPSPTPNGIIITPFSGVWVNRSSISTTSLSQFRANVAVVGAGGKILLNQFSPF